MPQETDSRPNLRWAEVAGGGAWDEIVCSCPSSGFMQATAWTEFKQTEGHRCWRLGLFRDDALIGGASLLGYPDSPIVVCPEGPVLPWDEDKVCRHALRDLCEFVHSTGAVAVRIEPHLPGPRPSMLRNWTPAPVNLLPEHTIIVDLREESDRWLARMHPKARYNIGVANRHGIEVVETTETGAVMEFHSLLVETAARNGFFAEPLSFFLNLAASLFPVGMARILQARLDGQTLASMILVTYGPRATYLYGASSGAHRETMPNYKMHWEALRLSKALGCVEYDLYGNDPFGHPDHLYAGISRFKGQWGGDQKSWMGAVDYTFYDRLAETIVARYAEK